MKIFIIIFLSTLAALSLLLGSLFLSSLSKLGGDGTEGGDLDGADPTDMRSRWHNNEQVPDGGFSVPASFVSALGYTLVFIGVLLFVISIWISKNV